jgi:hypothetical protein
VPVVVVVAEVIFGEVTFAEAMVVGGGGVTVRVMGCRQPRS